MALEFISLTTGRNDFCRIIDIRIESFPKHPHLYKQPPSRSMKPLKRKMKKLHNKYVFVTVNKAANNVIIFWKLYCVDVLKRELNSKTTYVPAQLTKDKFLLDNIDTFIKIDVKIVKCELPTFYWFPKLHKRSPYILSKIEVPRDVRNSKSENRTSSDENGLNIRTNASPKMGQDQVSGGVTVPCWLAAPVAMFYGNLRNLVIRSKSVIRSSSVISS